MAYADAFRDAGLDLDATDPAEAGARIRARPGRVALALATALDEGVEFGVWGGMTERERRALKRRRPDVDNWMDLLTDARTAHYRRETADSPQP